MKKEVKVARRGMYRKQGETTTSVVLLSFSHNGVKTEVAV